MDEPLAALDRRLREQVQLEIRRLHKELGTTILYVTHDQEEALVMADRVAVMRDGHLLQVGSPQQLYREPVDAFVASFLGRTNFLPVTVIGTGPGDIEVDVAGQLVRATRTPHSPFALNPPRNGERAQLSIRPERVIIETAGSGLPGVVREVIFTGATTSVAVECADTTVQAQLMSESLIHGLKPGDAVRVRWPDDAAHLYPDQF